MFSHSIYWEFDLQMVGRSLNSGQPFKLASPLDFIVFVRIFLRVAKYRAVWLGLRKGRTCYEGFSITGRAITSRGSIELKSFMCAFVPLPLVERLQTLAQALSKQALRPFMAYLRLALGIVDITQRTNSPFIKAFVGIRRRSVINIALGLCRLIA